MSEKPIYSPVPARAMGDHTLTGADLRVLMAVASHDRFGRNGTGCYASHARLAAILNMHAKAVARSIGRLRDRGYLTVGRNPLNARLAVYSIIYDEADATVMRGDGATRVRPTRPATVETGNKSATDKGETGNDPATDKVAATGNEAATDERAIGNSENRETQQNQRARHVNIFPERENRLGEALGLRICDRAGGEGTDYLADARRWVSEAHSGSIEPADAIDALRRIADRARFGGDPLAARDIGLMIESLETDLAGPAAINLNARPSPALLALQRERKQRGAA